MCNPQSIGFIMVGDWNAKSQMWGNSRGCHTLFLPFNRKANPSAIDFAVYSGFYSSHIFFCSTAELSSNHDAPIINAALAGDYKSKPFTFQEDLMVSGPFMTT